MDYYNSDMLKNFGQETEREISVERFMITN